MLVKMVSWTLGVSFLQQTTARNRLKATAVFYVCPRSAGAGRALEGCLPSAPRGVIWVSGRVGLASAEGHCLPGWTSTGALSEDTCQGPLLASLTRHGAWVLRSKHPGDSGARWLTF